MFMFHIFVESITVYFQAVFCFYIFHFHFKNCITFFSNSVVFLSFLVLYIYIYIYILNILNTYIYFSTSS